jgi:hypothetical protein
VVTEGVGAVVDQIELCCWYRLTLDLVCRGIRHPSVVGFDVPFNPILSCRWRDLGGDAVDPVVRDDEDEETGQSAKLCRC